MGCPGSVSSAASRDGKPLSLRSAFMPHEAVTPHELSLAACDLPSPLLLGPHRGSTDDLGSAKVELPKGAYDLIVWKPGYRALEKAVEVTADTTVQVEIELEPEPEQEYWMG